MDLIDESEERTAITSTPPPSDQPGARDPEEATAVSTAPPPRAPGNVQYRPGSGAIALDALMRTSGVDRSEPSATPDPFEAAATIVGALPVGPEPSAWDEEAPTDVITLPPPRDE